LVPIIEKLIQVDILRLISLNFLKQINDFFTKIETLNMNCLFCWCN